MGEFIGTGMLILLGQTVVSNVVLAKTKGHNSGWIVISFGWGMAVFVGVYCSAAASKAHLNPVVTLAFAVLGKFSWSEVPTYIAAQLLRVRSLKGDIVLAEYRFRRAPGRACLRRPDDPFRTSAKDSKRGASPRFRLARLQSQPFSQD